jgi:hypothetical protein
MPLIIAAETADTNALALGQNGRYKSTVIVKHKGVWWGAAAIALAGVVAGVIVAATGAAPSSSRDARWQRDIAYLAEKLPRVHIHGITGVSKDRWDATAASLESTVPRLTNGQVILGIMRLVALLHDDETTVQTTSGNPLVYPVDLQWIDGQLDLTAVPPAQRRLLGAQLEAVNGHPVSAILALLRPEIDYQDPGILATSEAQDMVSASLLAWLGVTPSARSAAFTVRTVSGSNLTIRLNAITALSQPWVRALLRKQQSAPPSTVYISADELEFTALGSASLAHVPLPLYQQNLTLPYWMQVLAAQRAVYLKYNGCLDTDGFQQLAAQALVVLRQHPDYRLIIDLRDNFGGDSGPFQALVDGIAADPAINQRGRIFGLINQRTDSSATVDAGSLSHQTNAIMVGQRVMDPIDEYGNEAGPLRLPYWGVSVQYTTAVVNSGKVQLVAPDIAVAPTLQQVLTGQDPVLQAALDYGSDG